MGFDVSRLRVLITSLSLMAVVMAPMGSLRAQEQPTAGQQTDDSLAFSITPPSREAIVKPGDILNGTVEVTNTTQNTVTLYPITRDFTASGDATSGAPQFFEQTPTDYGAGLASWVSYQEESATVGPKGTTSIHYTLTVPVDAQPGGHYGAIFLGNQPAESAVGVALSGRVGSLLLVTVSGKTTVQGDVTQFDLGETVLSPAKTLFEDLPMTIRMKLRNTGNVHVAPKGTITVVTMTGKTVITQDFNPEGGRILPNSERFFSQTIDRGLGFGRYDVTANFEIMAANGDQYPLTVTQRVTVLPVSLLVFGLFFLIVFFMLFRIWIRQHDHHVIQDAQSGKRD